MVLRRREKIDLRKWIGETTVRLIRDGREGVFTSWTFTGTGAVYICEPSCTTRRRVEVITSEGGGNRYYNFPWEEDAVWHLMSNVTRHTR